MKKIVILGCGVLAACALMLTACGNDFNLQVPTTEAHTHVFGEWKTVKEASCTEKGEQERVCACGERETKTIDKLPHTEGIDAAVAPSCTETGLTEGKHCLVCKEVLVKQEIVEATHTWSAEYQCDKYAHWICCDKCGTVGEKITHVLRGSQFCEVCKMEEPDGVYYNISADATYASAVFYGGTATVVKIVKEFWGLPVIQIEDDAFMWRDLIEVIIPDSVTTIGNGAFKECINLTSINIPDSVTTIGSEAFSGCSSLTNVTIPDSVTDIGASAFSGCRKLQYAEYGNCKYLGNEKNPYLVLIATVNSNESSYTIHHDTKVIAGNAFFQCDNLVSVTIPDGVVTIGTSAFYGCDNLISVTIGNSVATIGGRAFEHCSSLASVTIPDGVTNIGMSAFGYCSSLTDVIIPDSIVTVSNDVFTGCDKLQYTEYSDCKYLGNEKNPYLVLIAKTDINKSSYTIHPDTRVIASRAFYNCASLTSIIIPDNVVTIGSFAFDGCISLTSITIGNGINTIDDSAFHDCRSLTSVTIGNGVNYISYRVFNNCKSLTEIHFNGTKEQWNAIRKQRTWDDRTGNYTIYCTDGEIKK